VVNYPLQYMAERIGGELVRVGFPAPAEGDPALWSPDPAAVADYQGADLILLNGAGYAVWVARSTLPESKLVNTSAGFADEYLVVDEAVTHTHGPEGAHSHEATAHTTWLDPMRALAQAEGVHAAFVERWPQWQESFDAGLAGLRQDLTALDARQAAATAGDPIPLLASHPVYQYLADRYGLNVRSVHFEPGEIPDAAGWRELERILAEHPARWMLWEGEPLPQTAERLRALGVEPVVYDPAGNRPVDGDYLSVMVSNAEALERAHASGG
jgi:zinc transport system substrate-binding protein